MSEELPKEEQQKSPRKLSIEPLMRSGAVIEGKEINVVEGVVKDLPSVLENFYNILELRNGFFVFFPIFGYKLAIIFMRSQRLRIKIIASL